MAKELTIALAGNPNSGKTTLFNALTGSRQYVGNWPGVTVEKKEGKLKGHDDVLIEDLPGIYSLSPYTLEEVVSRKYLIDEKPDTILNIVDGTNIERNLYLTTQLAETGIPMVIAVNMMDIVRKTGDEIDIRKLSEKLGCEIVEISALNGEGIEEAAETAIRVAKANSKPNRMAYPTSIEQVLSSIEAECLPAMEDFKKRWYAVKVFERDEKVLEELNLSAEAKDKADSLVQAVETELDDDAESIITNERYEFITAMLKDSYRKKNTDGMTASDRIDQIVTNRWLALPIFALVMCGVYYVSISTIGTGMTDWVNDVLVAEILQGNIGAWLESAGAADWVVSLVVDGIIGGIGAPLGFAPQMAVVFFFLSVLEDCGYMARVAFIMDRIFRRFGLSGKSFIPFLISSGCAVPGIMATRTIENEKDRRMTMITTSSIPCGAKLPVIALIAGFLLGGAWWMAPSMYFAGIAVVVMWCVILKKTKMFAGDPAPFVMELPAYHIPSLKGVLIHVWERTWAFLKKAGTVLFVCCAVMWFLASFGFEEGVFGLVETENSLLAVVGNSLAWIFKPLGFGTWQAVASSVSGFVAKEGIVSTMGVLAGLGEVEEYELSMHDQFAAFFPTGIAAVSFLLFNMFDSPCLAAISTMSKEIGSRKWFWFAILFQNVNAYLLALIVYQLGGLATGDLTFGIGSVAAIIVLAGYLYLLFRPDPNKKKQVQAEVKTA